MADEKGIGKLKNKFSFKSLFNEESDDETLVEVKDENTDNPQKHDIFDHLAIDMPDLVAPEAASSAEDYFKVGDQYTRTLYIHTYPPQVTDNWLRDILRFQNAIDVAIYIHPIEIKPFVKRMRQQVARDEALIMKQEEEGVLVNAGLKDRRDDYKAFIESITQNITKPYQIMVAMTLRAKTLKELDRITEDLERSLTAIGTRQTRHRHKEGFLTTMPVMRNKLQEVRTKGMRAMHTQGLMSMFPLTSSDISHESGVMVGINQITGSPIILNRFMQPTIQSPNTAILGATGSGKSYFAKLEMMRWAYHGVPVMVLDPSGEYKRVCEALGGSNMDISLDSEHVINPLDFSTATRPGHNALREKIAHVLELIRMIIQTDNSSGGFAWDPPSRKLVENGLLEAYRKYGYTVADIDSQLSATPEHMPIFSDLLFMLRNLQRVDRDPDNQMRLKLIISSLSSFVGEGHLAPLFDQRTTVDLRSHFINFDYSRLAPQYHGLAMYLVLEYIRTSYFNNEQAESGQNRLLYVDEAQILMANPETSRFLEFTARTCRKYGVGLTVMTQDVGVFVLTREGNDNKEGQGVLAACTIKVLFSQQSSQADALARQFKLTTGEIQRLLNMQAGEGLLFVGSETAWFTARHQASQIENDICSTTTSERAEIRARQQREQITAGTSRPDDRVLHVNQPQPPQIPPGPAGLPEEIEDPFIGAPQLPEA